MSRIRGRSRATIGPPARASVNQGHSGKPVDSAQYREVRAGTCQLPRDPDEIVRPACDPIHMLNEGYVNVLPVPAKAQHVLQPPSSHVQS